MLRIAIFALALSAGGVAAWLSSSTRPSAAQQTAAAAPPAIAMVDVLVASVEVAHGTHLDEASLRWQPWPEVASSEAFISRTTRPDAINELTGQIVRNGFAAGEPIRNSSLVGANSGLLSMELQSGKRAAAVRVSAESTAGGFILPEDRVDVLHTSNTQAGTGNGEVLTRTILSNVRVLAIDQMTDERGNESVVGKTATLELDADQVETVTAAEASGAISLSLRSLSDNGEKPIINTALQRPIQVIRGGVVELVQFD